MKKQCKISKIIAISILFILILSQSAYCALILPSEGENSNYKYKILENGNIDITGFTDEYLANIAEHSIRELEFPREINGKTVERITTIDARKISDLRVIKIPSTVKVIGPYAFSDCESLISVSLEEGLETIGANAFYNCSSLEQLEIPSTVTSIGELAFSNCRKIKSVEIPLNVTTINAQTFQDCLDLEEIKFAKTEFGETNIKNIGPHAFQNCKQLKKITIPKSVEIIHDYAFAKCDNLQKIIVQNKRLMFIGDKVFYSSSHIDENGKENIESISGLTMFGFLKSTTEVYANAHEIHFEPLLTNVEKAGILMAEFAKAIVEKYGSHFPYSTSAVRSNHAFNMADYGSLEDNYNLSLDCVGTLNLIIYQSTGLWSKEMGKPESDPLYISPSESKTKLGATDLFDYINDFYYDNSTLNDEFENTIQKGDLIMLDGHVAMYCGLGVKNDKGTREAIDKPLAPESWDSTGLKYSNNIQTGNSAWTGTARILRMKENAANKLTVLDNFDKENEIAEYAKALADAYMKGEVEYKGEVLKRKSYSNNDIITIVDDDFDKIEGLVFDNIEETDGGEKIGVVSNIEINSTVGEFKKKGLPEGYTGVKIVNKYGGDVTNQDNCPIFTGMTITYYKDVEVSRAADISVGAEVDQGVQSIEYKVVVYGDVTGNGNPSAIDALTIVKNKTGKVPFKDPIYKIAGRVIEDSRVNKKEPSAADAFAIVKAKIGKYEINQGKFESENQDEKQEEEIKYNDNVIPIYTRADLEKVGSGEEVLIENIGEVYKMTTDAKYVLMNDIDLSDKPWTPIGLPEQTNEAGEIIRQSTVLTNVFEGNGHKIIGMEITGEQNTQHIGLFSVINGNVSHLNLEDVNIHDITYSEDAIGIPIDGKTVGTIAGYIKNAYEIIEINRCSVSGTISTEIEGDIGGLVGCTLEEGGKNKIELLKCDNNTNIETDVGSLRVTDQAMT